MNDKAKQTEDDFKSHLNDQIRFLESSSQSYDNGYINEAKRLAVVIRVLLHDTSRSTSLLTHLKKKDILFYDTSSDYNPNNLLSQMMLIMMGNGPHGAEYVPVLDNGPPIHDLKKKVPFEDWWKKVVFVDTKGNNFDRKYLITKLANKDGGAHVDPKLDAAYANLTRFNSLGWVFERDGIHEDLGNPILASARQISYEVLKSLKDAFSEYF